MPLSISLVILLTLTILSTSACSEGPKPYFRLLKYGEATSLAIIDAYKYALAQRYGRIANVDNSIHSPITHKFDTLCSPVDSRHISNELLRENCAVLLNKKYEACEDIHGCIELKAHPDIQKDEELNALLISAVRNPCAYIPQQDSIGNERFHWGGYYDPNYITANILNCGKYALPYSNVYINYGNLRVEINLADP